MKKIRKLWQVKFFKNYFILIISFLLLETIFRVIEGNNLITYSYLRIFIGLNIISLILSLLLNYMPKLVAKIFNPLITFFLGVYGIAQLGFNNYLGVYASLQIKSQASAVTSYFWEFLSSFKFWSFSESEFAIICNRKTLFLKSSQEALKSAKDKNTALISPKTSARLKALDFKFIKNIPFDLFSKGILT